MKMNCIRPKSWFSNTGRHVTSYLYHFLSAVQAEFLRLQCKRNNNMANKSSLQFAHYLFTWRTNPYCLRHVSLLRIISNAHDSLDSVLSKFSIGLSSIIIDGSIHSLIFFFFYTGWIKSRKEQLKSRSCMQRNCTRARFTQIVEISRMCLEGWAFRFLAVWQLPGPCYSFTSIYCWLLSVV